MLFNSFVFVILFLITFFLYYVKKLSGYQVQILIISSLIFYSYHKPILLLLLLISAGINIYTSYKVVYGNPSHRKTIATIGVLLNLLILGFFKYSPLISKTFFDLGSSAGEFLLTIPLPIGISFYTFQGVSLLVDVYKENYFKGADIIPHSLTKHAQRTLFFISFFPNLVAGPIVKAHDFLPQIKTKYITDIQWERCFKNIILGYFLKMVIADNLKDFTFWAEYPYFEMQTTIPLLILLFGYSCQIFADFAGYSLIAIGLAQTFGYQLRANFDFPYISGSFKEFWKRWHISLSSFLMEYLYIPLGGNRKGKFRTYVNLIITMLLGGLWHGAAWSYVVWGGVHGFALAIERFFTRNKKDTEKDNFISRNSKRIFVFIFVTFAWLFFKLPQFDHVVSYLRIIFTKFSYSVDPKMCVMTIIYMVPVLCYHLLYLYKDNKYFHIVKKYEYVLYGFMLFLIFTNSGSPGAFVYFQF